MKKIRNLVLILALFMCFNGCEKNPAIEDPVASNDELTVDQAKAFIEMQSINQFTLKAGNMQEQAIKIRADWSKAKRSNNGEISVVETQIQAMGQFGFATVESMNAVEITKNENYKYSMSRLVVIKNKKTGEIYSFIMSIAGDRCYLEDKKFKLWDNTYLKRDKDLSGIVLFHNLSGTFVNGWIYCDGTIINSITEATDIDIPVRLKSTAEMQMDVYLWVQTCTDYFDIGIVGGSIVSVSYSRTTCNCQRIHLGSYIIGSTSLNGGGGISGEYHPTPLLCDCPECPICGGCLDQLKNAIIDPVYEEGNTTTTIPCEMCAGHPETDPNIPCAGDPIKNATIASSGASGQYGGTYGCVRQGGTTCSDGIYNKKHGGLDVYAQENSDLYSISSGKVSYVGYITDLGNCIQVTSSDNSTSILYAHLNSQSLAVGNDVKIGDKLGLTGKTGNASDPAIIPHVHIQIKVNGVATDPQPFLSTTFNSDGSVSVPCNN